MKSLLVIIGAIIIAICGYKMVFAPIDSSPYVNQFYVYGFSIGGIIAGIGLYREDNSNSDTK